MNLQLYALHDSDEELKKHGAFAINRSDADELNRKGYGIFHTPNEFEGQRKKSNLKKINYWIADIDKGGKEIQRDAITEVMLFPSVIVETKKGYHCYWKAKDATEDNYTLIEQGIIERLDADKGCKDVTRLLRSPGYLHQKNVNEPYEIRIVYKKDIDYCEKEMLHAFRIERKKYTAVYKKYSGEKEQLTNPDNWDRIFGLNRITNGNRNNELTRITYWLVDLGFSSSEVESIIFQMNERISPLPEREIRSILRGKI